MKLIYNNQELKLMFSGNLKQLLEQQNIDNTKVSIQLNNQIIPRNKWEEYNINSEDVVYVIEIIAGG